MSYWKTQGKTISSLESFGLGNSQASSAGGGQFYEMEPAVVLDIILDSKHPVYTGKVNIQTGVDADRWPANVEGKKPDPTDKNFSLTGQALIRMIYSDPTIEKDKLVWATPLDNSVTEYPLVNEVVMVVQYGTRYFYTKKINTKNFPNESIDFAINQAISGQINTEYGSPDAPFTGPKSVTKFNGGFGYQGYAGKYFKVNSRMRSLRRYEGDLVIESRFGQSIRLGAYDDNRDNDNGADKNTDYKDGGGNPMIVIRNRQRKILKPGESLKLTNSSNPATITGTQEEKNAGGYIESDINHDGSTIAITSGKTISKWVTTCYKKMFGVNEEVSAFKGQSTFKWPILNGDQVIINSDRLIFSSRYGETLCFSKKRYGIVTDSEFTVDAHDQIVMTTHVKTVLNSPAIYLGEYDQTSEPALLGTTTIEWLRDFCNLFIEHAHKHSHSHVDAGAPSPKTTQQPIDPHVQKAIQLRDSLNKLLSRRVFVTGGGYAPGQNGASL